MSCDTQFGAGEEFAIPAGTGIAGVRSAAWCSGTWTATSRSTTTGWAWWSALRRRCGPRAATRRSTSSSSATRATRTCRRRLIDPNLNSKAFADPQTPGAQIFKFIASNDLHAVGNATKKIALVDPQIENLFAAPGTTSICNWKDVGGDAATTNDNVTICQRDPGSGTKETFRNTWLLNAKGSTTEGVGSSAGVSGNCLQTIEPATGNLSTKTFFSLGGTNDVQNCVETRQGSIGYTDASDDTPNSYGVPVEGVDPDTNDLKLLVKCGQYRFWGPLAGGRPNNPALSDRGNATATAAETAHRFALASPAAFPSAVAYLPFGSASQGGVAVRKNVTDGAYPRVPPEQLPRAAEPAGQHLGLAV